MENNNNIGTLRNCVVLMLHGGVPSWYYLASAGPFVVIMW